MAYSISHSFKDGTMRMDISGAVDGAGARALNQEVMRIVQTEQVARLLIDARALQGHVGPVDALNIIRDYPQDPATMHRRVAVLVTPAQAGDSSFHETAARNRGHLVRHFTERFQAEAWLFAAA